MIFFLMLIGIITAFSVNKEKPAHVNYSLAVITAASFLAAALTSILGT
ncbi:hypothetical protein [Acinetobacter schindleri]|nr:hypothetical protein [Acinetobacter schindleri]WBX38992.1 hypothetical protein MYA84_04940 [Acinetobacter schindleri]